MPIGEETMQITKRNYRMIALGLLLTFTSTQPLLSAQEAVLTTKEIEASAEMEGYATAELDQRESRTKIKIGKMNLIEKVNKVQRKTGSTPTKQPGTLIAAKEDWEEFNFDEKASTPKEWHEEIGDTFKKTSVTGKGPLWAKVATSIAISKPDRGEPMCGFKMKI